MLEWGQQLVFYEGNEIYAGFLIRYKLDTKQINPKYLFSFTKLDEYLVWVKNNQSGTAQPGINAKKYDMLEVPVPPIEMQNEFASFVEQIDKSKYVSKVCETRSQEG
ncbi:MAG: restriction endonuclease subunit S [Erysipelotrichaceae bacterium]